MGRRCIIAVLGALVAVALAVALCDAIGAGRPPASADDDAGAAGAQLFEMQWKTNQPAARRGREELPETPRPVKSGPGLEKNGDAD